MKVLPGFGRRTIFPGGELTGEALPGPPQLLRPYEAPPNIPEIRFVRLRSREGVFQPISRNRGVVYCQNEEGLLQPRARTEK